MPRVTGITNREAGKLEPKGQGITGVMPQIWPTQVVTLPFMHKLGEYHLWLGQQKI